MNSICIFLGSDPGADPVYTRAAWDLRRMTLNCKGPGPKIHRLIFTDPSEVHFGDFFQRAGLMPSKILVCWAFGSFLGQILHATFLVLVLRAFTDCNKNSFITLLSGWRHLQHGNSFTGIYQQCIRMGDPGIFLTKAHRIFWWPCLADWWLKIWSPSFFCLPLKVPMPTFSSSD